MKYKLIIGGVALAALFIAGSALAADRGGSDNEQDGHPSVSQNETEGRVPRPQNLGKLQDGQDGVSEQNASGTISDQQNTEREQNRGEMQNKEREQNREENRIGTSSEREHRGESASSSDNEQQDGNATSTEGERQREQHRSEVAKAVQALLSVADRDGGIGEEVRTIAKAQEENHAKINDSLKKVEDRNPVAKFFFGPNQTEIDNAKQIVAQNETQIQQLTDLKSRMATGTDQSVIDSQIQLLQKVNAEASSTLSRSEKGFSLFGWMFRIFGR